MSVGLFLIASIATARATRLVAEDTFTEPFRDLIANHAERRFVGWLHELVTCAWCVSGWAAGAVTVGLDITTGVTAPVVMWLAVWWGSNVAYWLLEIIFETHEQFHWRREQK